MTKLDLEGTLERLKIPSKSVIVPLVVPYTNTEAPMMASPLASVTVPFTVSS